MENNNIGKTKTAVLTWVSYKTKDLAWTLGLVAASIITPAILAHTPNNQWLTGTIVNAILFLSALRLGVVNSILIAALPSSVALLRGLLPAPMAMLIPFIIVSNVILVSVFNLLCAKLSFEHFPKLSFSAAIAGLAKFGFLYAVTLIYAGKLATPFVMMMQWPQLITALTGAVVAIGMIKIFNFQFSIFNKFTIFNEKK